MRYLRVVSIAALLAVAPMFRLFADLQIVFYSDREGREIAVGQRESEVFVMNPDGSNPVNLTKQIGVDRLPSVSPDKTKYLFSSNRTGDNEIILMNVDGSNRVNLTNDPESDQSPRWSPDGTQIRNCLVQFVRVAKSVQHRAQLLATEDSTHQYDEYKGTTVHCSYCRIGG